MMSEERSLPALLEQDREMVMAQLGADRSQEAALRVLEKEADRMMYRASMGEDASGEGVPEGAASAMLQVLKNMLPLVGAVSEAEVWEKEGGRGDRDPRDHLHDCRGGLGRCGADRAAGSRMALSSWGDTICGSREHPFAAWRLSGRKKHK